MSEVVVGVPPNLGPTSGVADLRSSLRLAQAEIARLAEANARLLESEETLRAIRGGEVDAVVVSNGKPGAEVFTLASADRPYRSFVENMQEGAATLSDAGILLFANERLGELLGCESAQVVARHLSEFVTPESRPELMLALSAPTVGRTLELRLLRPGGGEVAALVGVSSLEVENERLTCLTFTDLTAEHALLNQVRASQQRFKALYKGAPVPAHTWQASSEGLVLIDYNHAAARLTGGKVANALGTTASDYYLNDQLVARHMARCLVAHVVVERDIVSVDPATPGQERHLHLTMVPVPPDLVVVHTEDVTESWVAERALRSSEERYRTIVENAHEGIAIVDADGLFTFANQRTAELLGRPVSEVTGTPATQLLGTAVVPVPPGSGRPGTAQYEVIAVRSDGSDLVLLVSTAPIVLPGGDGAGSLCMMSDVSGLRDAEEKLAHLAVHDPLTGLPNRILLVDRIEVALARRARRAQVVAALFCDLDGFKDVNDSYGHHVGDEVLKAVATRLGIASRASDTVGRIGGDEFVILCEDVEDTAAFGLASRIVASLAEPFDVGGHQISLSASIGVAFARSDEPGELLRNADAAMYLAKQRGRNRVELFDEHLRKVAADRIKLIADLRHAVERDQLRVHYQPVFSLDGENLVGVEALVRWQHPRRGLLQPNDFIPAAESANLIGELGAWVLRTACRQAATWGLAGPGGGALGMAVNVSARQLAAGSGFVQLVADAVQEAGIDPAALILEVTESVVMDDARATLSIMTELKQLGVQLAIDDFGTGYSSLVYLKRFPVDRLKIDRTFVSGLGRNPDDSAIVASVVGLAHAVGIVAVAEGVETGDQLVALQDLGCTFGQGFIWSEPVPARELNRRMNAGTAGLQAAAR